jgi:PAS domain-containing protein
MPNQASPFPLQHGLTHAVLAAQALSGEHEFDKMLETIVRTLLERAGAQKGWIFLPAGKHWVAAAEGTAQESGVRVSLPAQNGAAIPVSVIRQLKKQCKPIFVPDLRDGPENGQALYLPMFQQRDLAAVLRLEIKPGSLDSGHLDMLVLLATQAAISLSNLRMVDELKIAEQAARANELKFRHLFENTPMGIFEIDISGVLPIIRAANRRAEAQFGWTEEQLLQMDPGVLLLPEAGWELRRLVGAVSKGETATL